jgi:hypothetical protein
MINLTLVDGFEAYLSRFVERDDSDDGLAKSSRVTPTYNKHHFTVRFAITQGPFSSMLTGHRFEGVQAVLDTCTETHFRSRSQMLRWLVWDEVRMPEAIPLTSS